VHVSDWLTIRVVLQGQPDAPLEHPPGRVLLAHADHSFGELAEAIDGAFARWDVTPLHRFDVEGRVLLPGGADGEEEGEDVEDSDEVTVGEVGLRAGNRFSYVFDLGERWQHDCLVEDVTVDPFEVAGDEPEVPVAVYGWGTIPDQYGRISEDDEEPEPVDLDLTELLDEELFEADEIDDLESPGAPTSPGVDLGDVDLADGEEPGEDEDAAWEEIEEELAAWAENEAAAWSVVQDALEDVPRTREADALAGAAARLRDREDNDEWPYDALWAAADLDDGDLPDDDEELWLELAAGIVAPHGDLPVDVDTAAAWASLEPADWAGAVIELVRGDIGQPAGPGTLVDLIARCPEVESEELSDEDRAVLESAMETVGDLWQALGALDDDRRLTPLGHWGLPEALRRAWVR
jgi:hypothetical protein